MNHHAASLPAPEGHAARRLDLAVVIPTFNERGNIAELIRRLDLALQGLYWEAIFVDDDSPDGTADLVRSFARRDTRIRILQRIHRRGLASACIEGIMSSSAEVVAVMDADLQHDESILPQMLQRLRSECLDVVIGTRNAVGGSMGDFASHRILLSRLGDKLSRAVCACNLSDPMSGYFLVTRSFFMEVAHHLQSTGFKILVDIFASSVRPVRFDEVGYCFRCRQHGASKLDINTGVEYLFLILNKFLGAAIPPRFVMFSLVGAVGIATHLLALGTLLYAFHARFFLAQAIATYIAMTGNFFINNAVTYRDRSLRGARLVTGLASFWIACSFGAWANVIFARVLLAEGHPWYLAGLAGIILSSVWNYTISNLATWQKKRDDSYYTYTPELIEADLLQTDTPD
ncbi:glycosyltransferase family 2 protein [Granulicella sp. 5B5]|uniref:glycosyltransferase n=1 Tax=Granulicella sp. 5B5 TaxID=1617967 RepID=UPI001C70D7A4|nr:glycosyltransferase family 2 protein [Granulicella sp. 5B5]